MNDQEYKHERARLDRLRRKWVRTLGLGWWKITFVYNRSDPEHAGCGPKPGFETAAVASVLWEYHSATITFNMRTVAKLDDRDLEDTYLHELGHVFLNQMRAYRSGTDSALTEIAHEESVATSLASAFRWAWEAGRDAGRAERRARKSARKRAR